MTPLGTPHLHATSISSTNDRARELATAGAPHGAIVTADEQTAGRGRRGRSWQAPPGQALLLSVLLRSAPSLLTLRAAVAVAEACGETAQIKWPNDIVIADRKVAGILCEQRPREDWTVAGIGVNVAVDLDVLEPELRDTAGTLGLAPADIPAFRSRLLSELEAALEMTEPAALEAWSARDALAGHAVEWSDGTGVAAGVDDQGRLLVDLQTSQTALDSGEVSLVRRA